ncbi:MAG TPA: hypothetical protein VM582_04085, partial [Candidatus Thermoplasmatota archaeon]|nr:hypothetical protein [Candidatus Thermoplasmatota archaeon]
MHVLEAVLIASIMLSAVAFVVTFEQPGPPTRNARNGLETRAQDILDILHDTPADEAILGDNELSAYIAMCMNKRCQKLEEKLAKLVPPGASYALYLSNGYDTYPVLIQGEPHGEAVTGSRTFQPGWSSTFLATAQDSVNPNDALLVYGLPIFHSTAVTAGGSQVLVKVIGTRADGSDYVMLASAATVAQSAGDAAAVAASLYFVDGNGAPLPAHDISPAGSGPRRLTLRLEETQGGEIPAGAEVTVHMPRGWTATAPQADNPDWTVLQNADNKNGSYVGSAVVAALNAPLRNGIDPIADLHLDLVYHGDVLDYYSVVASMSRGASATAGLILRGEQHSREPELATPMLHVGAPSPMGRGAPTTWTLSAHLPVNDSGLPNGMSAIVRVHTIELIEQEGNAIFGSNVVASPSEAMGGSWLSYGDRIVWSGDVVLDHTKVLNLTFRVGASGTPGPGEVRAHFVPPVSFDEWTGRLVSRTGWGFYRQTFLPRDDVYAGYNPAADALGIQHQLATTGVYRQTALPGEIPYTVSLAAAIEDSLYGSYVSAEKRSVPIGGDVVINVNVQSVLFTLAEAGQRAGVTLRFYGPWSGNDRAWVF